MWPMLDTMTLRTHATTDPNRIAGTHTVLGPAAATCGIRRVLHLFSGVLVGLPRRVGRTRTFRDSAWGSGHTRCSVGSLALPLSDTYDHTADVGGTRTHVRRSARADVVHGPRPNFARPSAAGCKNRQREPGADSDGTDLLMGVATRLPA